MGHQTSVEKKGLHRVDDLNLGTIAHLCWMAGAWKDLSDAQFLTNSGLAAIARIVYSHKAKRTANSMTAGSALPSFQRVSARFFLQEVRMKDPQSVGLIIDND